LFLTKIAIWPVLSPRSFAARFTFSLFQRRRLVPTQLGAFGGHWCVPGCVRVLPHAGREEKFRGGPHAGRHLHCVARLLSQYITSLTLTGTTSRGNLTSQRLAGLMFFFFKQWYYKSRQIRWSAITCCWIHLGLFGSAVYYINM
jgi:hypothetical protein